jgi:hypothetical protein
MEAPTFSVEAIILSVTDVERALRFYVDQVGFTLDVDYASNDTFRVVQLSPPGLNCSIQIGNGLTDAPAGSVRSIYLVVTDMGSCPSENTPKAATRTVTMRTTNRYFNAPATRSLIVTLPPRSDR